MNHNPLTNHFPQAGGFKFFEARPGIGVILLPNPPTYTIVAVSNDFVRTSGMTREQVIGKGHFEVFPESPDDPNFTGEQNLTNSFAYIIQHKKPHEIPQQRYDIPNGYGTFSHRYWKSINAPVLDHSGAVQYIIHTAMDITDQVQLKEVKAQHSELQAAYKKLHENEEKYRSLFNSIDEGACIIELIYGESSVPINYRFLETNAVFEQQSGLRGPAGKTIRDFLPDLETRWFQLYGNVAATGESMRFVERTEAVDKWHDVFAFRLGGNESRKVVVLFNDITARIKTEQALKQSEENLRNLIAQAPVAMCLVKGPDHVVDVMNDDMLNLLGKPGDDVLHSPLFKAVPQTKGQGLEESLYQVYTKGETLIASERPVQLRRNGKEETFYFHFAYEPFRQGDGTISGVMIAATDVTEQVLLRKKVEESEADLQQRVLERTKELEKVNQELRRSNQNLEEFAHAASHDLKEPIRKIHFFTNQLKEQLRNNLKEAEMRSFTRIENATQRMNNLIDDLLLYSHVSQRPHERETVDLNEKMHNVLEDLELDITEKKAVIKVEKLPTVNGYRRQLQQLFQNLLSNALKYSRADVPPCINIAADEAIENGKSYHVIVVSDNGIGFDQQYDEKIFQMFTRLHGKAEYSGTGVGLSIVKKVVENHNGSIKVESTPGEGSTFRILLPAE